MSTIQANNLTVSIELDPDNQPGVFTVMPELTGDIHFDKEPLLTPIEVIKETNLLLRDYTFTVNYKSYHHNNNIYRALRKYLIARRLGSDKTKRLRKKKYMSRYHDEVIAKVASMRVTGKAW